MKKYYVLLTMVVFCFAMMSVTFAGFDDPVVIFSDIFDDLDQWTDETGAHASLSTDQVWEGDNSVHFLSTADVGQGHRLITAVSYVDTDLEKLTFTYYLYDPLGQGGTHAWASGRFGLSSRKVSNSV